MTRRANTSDSPLRPAPPGPGAPPLRSAVPLGGLRCQITVGEQTTAGSRSPAPDDGVHVVLPGRPGRGAAEEGRHRREEPGGGAAAGVDVTTPDLRRLG